MLVKGHCFQFMCLMGGVKLEVRTEIPGQVGIPPPLMSPCYRNLWAVQLSFSQVFLSYFRFELVRSNKFI